MKHTAKVSHDGSNFRAVLYEGDNVAQILEAPELPVKAIRDWVRS